MFGTCRWLMGISGSPPVAGPTSGARAIAQSSGTVLFAYATGGDFTAELRNRGECRARCDQAGTMVRIDERHWVKAGIEFTDGSRPSEVSWP